MDSMWSHQYGRSGGSVAMTMKKIIAIVSIMVSVGILFACAKQKGVTARDFSVGMQMTRGTEGNI